jgi:hypothetical protein
MEKNDWMWDALFLVTVVGIIVCLPLIYFGVI